MQALEIWAASVFKGAAKLSFYFYSAHHSLEFFNPIQHFHIFVIAKIIVVSTTMPGIERVVSDHVECLKNGTE